MLISSDWHVVCDARLSETSDANVMMTIVLVDVLVMSHQTALLSSDWHVVCDVRLSEASEANVMMTIVLVDVLVMSHQILLVFVFPSG